MVAALMLLMVRALLPCGRAGAAGSAAVQRDTGSQMQRSTQGPPPGAGARARAGPRGVDRNSAAAPLPHRFRRAAAGRMGLLGAAVFPARQSPTAEQRCLWRRALEVHPPPGAKVGRARERGPGEISNWVRGPKRSNARPAFELRMRPARLPRLSKRSQPRLQPATHRQIGKPTAPGARNRELRCSGCGTRHSAAAQRHAAPRPSARNLLHRGNRNAARGVI